MMGTRKKVLIVAGESSGDRYGGKLVRAIRSLYSQVDFHGIGGSEMERSGAHLLFSSSELSVVGITEVLGKMRTIWRAWKELKRFILTHGVNLAVLIDYPGFNLRLARILKAQSIPVLYYISPQVWAWHSGRIKKIAQRVDKMAVVLPFEEPLYRSAGVDVEFVGHPILDVVNDRASREESRTLLGIPFDALLIGLLPGSREREVKALLPPLMGAAQLLQRDFSSCRFVLPLADSVARRLVDRYVEGSQLRLDIVDGRAFEVMKAADLLLVASGTATLEGVIANVPMVIVYKVSPISYLIGRIVVNVKCIGLANIVTGKKVVPELVQADVSPQGIAHEARKILEDDSRRQEIARQFALAKQKLGGRGATQRVAQIAVQMMGMA